MTQSKPTTNEHWERLNYIIKWSGLTINSFAEYIGVKRAENLYQIKKGNNKISLRLADKIIGNFPDVNKIWLVHGRGEPFEENVPHTVTITADNNTKNFKIMLEITITARVLKEKINN